MRKTIIATILSVATALAVAAPTPARADRDAEKAIALLLALGIGIAAAKQARQNHHDDWDNDLYGEPFSPGNGVVCLPKPRKCYVDGRISWRWTNRIFG